MSRKVVIRSEIGAAVGMGHAMRCLWIAKAVQDGWPADVTVISEASPAIERLADAHGISRGFAAEGCRPDCVEDAESILERQPDLVVVDSPHAGSLWARRIRQANVPLVVLSGVAGPQLVSDGSLWPESCPDDIPSGRFACGHRFIPLAPDYWQGPRRTEPHSQLHVLITCGGVDHYDISSAAIRCLDQVFADPCLVRVVVGAFYDNVDRIERAAAASRHNIELIRQPSGLSPHLTWCDFAVSAGGTTLYEMCALGVPGIGVAVWPLQQPVVDNVAGAGAIMKITYRDNDAFADDLTRAFRQICAEPGCLVALANAGPNYIDGRGALRAADWLRQFCI